MSRLYEMSAAELAELFETVLTVPAIGEPPETLGIFKWKQSAEVILELENRHAFAIRREYLKRAAELLRPNASAVAPRFYALAQCQDPDGEYYLVCAGTRIIARCGKLPGVDVRTDITGRALLQLVADANAGRISKP